MERSGCHAAAVPCVCPVRRCGSRWFLPVQSFVNVTNDFALTRENSVLSNKWCWGNVTNCQRQWLYQLINDPLLYRYHYLLTTLSFAVALSSCASQFPSQGPDPAICYFYLEQQMYDAEVKSLVPHLISYLRAIVLLVGSAEEVGYGEPRWKHRERRKASRLHESFQEQSRSSLILLPARFRLGFKIAW